MLGRLVRVRGGCRAPCDVTSPDESPAFCIDHRIGKKQFFFQICKVLVIEMKTSFQCPIRHTSLTLEQCKYLREDFIEGHS